MSQKQKYYPTMKWVNIKPLWVLSQGFYTENSKQEWSDQ